MDIPAGLDRCQLSNYKDEYIVSIYCQSQRAKFFESVRYTVSVSSILLAEQDSSPWMSRTILVLSCIALEMYHHKFQHIKYLEKINLNSYSTTVCLVDPNDFADVFAFCFDSASTSCIIIDRRRVQEFLNLVKLNLNELSLCSRISKW